MFAFIKKLFAKPTPPPPAIEDEDFDDEGPELPGITFTVLPDGKIEADCFWPEPKTEAGFELVVTRLGQLMFALNEGRCYPIIQQALGSAASHDGSDVVAQRVLHLLNQSMAYKQQSRQASTGPCIPPTAAFDPRPDGVPLN